MEEKVIKTNKDEENKDCNPLNETKSKLFMLEEMLDSMKESYENGAKTAAEQQLLVDAMKHIQAKGDATDKQKDCAVYLSHDWSKFIEGILEMKESVLTNISKLKERIDKLEHVISIAKEDNIIAKNVELLLDALGVFDR